MVENLERNYGYLISREGDKMNRETFWTGYYFYVVVQGTLIAARLVKLIEVSWWLVFIPTILVLLGGFAFLIYFGLTCNPRIEKDEEE